jgi:hypothetical protein
MNMVIVREQYRIPLVITGRFRKSTFSSEIRELENLLFIYTKQSFLCAIENENSIPVQFIIFFCRKGNEIFVDFKFPKQVLFL